MDLITALPLLQIHITAVFTTLAVVVVADAHGLLWVLGKRTTLPHKTMTLLHYAVWTGLAVTISAGFSMFLSYPEYLLSLPAFRLKLMFIGFLLLNAFFIGKHVHVATVKPFAELSQREKTILLVSGIVSTLGWVGAYTCAQFLS